MTSRNFITIVVCLALAALAAPVPVDAQPGHWRTEEEFLRDTGPEWQRIAPGVYEMARENGRVTRIGFGVESFRWALEEARVEQAELLGKTFSPAIEKELRASADLIDYLQGSLARAEADLSTEQARLSNKASDSGYTCNGNYSLDVALTCGYQYGTTTSTATWSEFGPLAPYEKTMYTYARAAMSTAAGAAYDEDSDSYGPFSYACCVTVESEARTPGPTFTPFLSGRAHISITNGCSDFRFIQDSIEC